MGIFAKEKEKLFTTYQVKLDFAGQVRGGTPKDPKIIEGWLRSKVVKDEDEIRHMMITTLRELGAVIAEDATHDQIIEASGKMAGNLKAQGFKRDEKGLYVEARCVKAMIKEAVSVAFYGKKWMKYEKRGGDMTQGKTPKSLVAERVFVDPDRIYLGREEPDGVDTFIGHVMGPTGPRSTMGYYDFVSRPTLRFQVKVLDDFISLEEWTRIWNLAEDLAFGAQRSQGYGRFDINRWGDLGDQD